MPEHWPCVFNCMSHLTAKGYILYTGCHSKPCQFHRKSAAFLPTSPGSFTMLLRGFRNVLPISNSKQQTAGNSGFLGQVGAMGLPSAGNTYFSHCDLAFFNHFLTLFPRTSRLLSRSLSINRSNSVLFLQQARYSHLKQEDPTSTPSS
jgi:hypothetical protein